MIRTYIIIYHTRHDIHKQFLSRKYFKVKRIDCLFEIRKIAVCFLWLLLSGDYRVTDEALLAETT